MGVSYSRILQEGLGYAGEVCCGKGSGNRASGFQPGDIESMFFIEAVCQMIAELYCKMPQLGNGDVCAKRYIGG